MDIALPLIVTYFVTIRYHAAAVVEIFLGFVRACFLYRPCSYISQFFSGAGELVLKNLLEDNSSHIPAVLKYLIHLRFPEIIHRERCFLIFLTRWWVEIHVKSDV